MSKNKALEPLNGLRNRFLEPSGWLKSKYQERPVRQDDEPLPWFTYGAIEYLNRVVTRKSKVFEFGSGYSTLWWQDRALSVHSTDHDAHWVNELKPLLKANVTLSLIEPNAYEPPVIALPYLEQFEQRTKRTSWPYDKSRIVRRGLDDRNFEAYASSILLTETNYDFIVIDGMARRLCTEFAVNRVEEDGVIILDNSNRSDYDSAFDILQEAGFKQIPFWGLVPGADFLTCTSFFVKSINSLPDAKHANNSFGLPEY